MPEMTDGELAVKYAIESMLRKVLAAAKDAQDKEEIIKRIKALLGEEG